jgi:hypothetical protein
VRLDHLLSKELTAPVGVRRVQYQLRLPFGVGGGRERVVGLSAGCGPVRARSSCAGFAHGWNADTSRHRRLALCGRVVVVGIGALLGPERTHAWLGVSLGCGFLQPATSARRLLRAAFGWWWGLVGVGGGVCGGFPCVV